MFMGNYFPQALAALTQYVERGQKVLAHLAANEVDEALDVLKWRNAAFHNFKVADFLELQVGNDVGKDEVLRSLWLESERLNTEIALEIKAMQAKITKQLTKVQKVRSAIGKFRSGEKPINQYVKESI
jgi:hypothetical protein